VDVYVMLVYNNTITTFGVIISATHVVIIFVILYTCITVTT